MLQVVEHMLYMCEDLGLIHSTTQSPSTTQIKPRWALYATWSGPKKQIYSLTVSEAMVVMQRDVGLVPFKKPEGEYTILHAHPFHTPNCPLPWLAGNSWYSMGWKTHINTVSTLTHRFLSVISFHQIVLWSIIIQVDLTVRALF